MRRVTFLIMGLVLVVCFGCGGLKGYVESYAEIGRERGMSEEYLNALKTWTRNETAYSEFETKFYISSTYKSGTFNQAFVKERARLLMLSNAERSRREGIQSEVSAEFSEFFFYAYTAVRAANDFADRNSTWRVFLLDEAGRQIDPLELRKVEKVTPIMESFFPYIHKYYGSCYTVKFPRQSSPRLKLVFASHLGKMELLWDLDNLR